jgi:hypothetical protein
MLARLHATPVWGADLFRAQCPCHRRAVRLLLLWYERRLHLVCAQRCPEAAILESLGLTPAALRPPPGPARDAPMGRVAGQQRPGTQLRVQAGPGRLGTVERAVVQCLSARQQSPPTRAALLALLFGWVPDRPRRGAGLRAPLHYSGVPREEYRRKHATLSRALRTLRQKGLVQPQRTPLLLTGKGRALAAVLQR